MRHVVDGAGLSLAGVSDGQRAVVGNGVTGGIGDLVAVEVDREGHAFRDSNVLGDVCHKLNLTCGSTRIKRIDKALQLGHARNEAAIIPDLPRDSARGRRAALRRLRAGAGAAGGIAVRREGGRGDQHGAHRQAQQERERPVCLACFHRSLLSFFV